MIEDGRPIRARRRTPAARALALLTALAVARSPAAARRVAAGAGAGACRAALPLIRDAEIEQLLRDYTQPILRAAGLAQQNIQVIIINDRSFNAFVMDGRRIFINAGALFDAKTPNEIIGVLAHETGHIAGGHLSRLRQQLAKAQTASIIAMLLGVGAMVAAARSGGNVGNVGAAAILAPQVAIRRSLLSYQRAQEEQADRAGVKFLAATGQSAKGMFEPFKRLADESCSLALHADPYLQSHPMPAERVAALEAARQGEPLLGQQGSAGTAAAPRHDARQACPASWIGRDTVARRYPLSDTACRRAMPAPSRPIAMPICAHAIAQIDGLIQTQPNNPYFYELKGQALLEGGKPAEAIAPLRRAVALAHAPR